MENEVLACSNCLSVEIEYLGSEVEDYANTFYCKSCTCKGDPVVYDTYTEYLADLGNF